MNAKDKATELESLVALDENTKKHNSMLDADLKELIVYAGNNGFIPTIIAKLLINHFSLRSE